MWSSHSTWRLILAHGCPPPSQPTPADCMQGIPRRLSAAHSLGCWGIRDIQYLPREAGVKTPTRPCISLQPYMFFCHIVILYLDIDTIKSILKIEAGTHITVPKYSASVHFLWPYSAIPSTPNFLSPLQLWLDCCDYEGLGSSIIIPERETERGKDGRQGGFPQCWSQ